MVSTADHSIIFRISPYGRHSQATTDLSATRAMTYLERTRDSIELELERATQAASS